MKYTLRIVFFTFISMSRETRTLWGQPLSLVRALLYNFVILGGRLPPPPWHKHVECGVRSISISQRNNYNPTYRLMGPEIKFLNGIFSRSVSGHKLESSKTRLFIWFLPCFFPFYNTKNMHKLAWVFLFRGFFCTSFARVNFEFLQKFAEIFVVSKDWSLVPMTPAINAKKLGSGFFSHILLRCCLVAVYSIMFLFCF
jgi:hypothetical protein